MKRVLTLFLTIVMVAALSACQSNTYELALITDLGTIDDKSFNQGSWEGLLQYTTENDVTHNYYQPAEQSDDAYLEAIDLAIKGGARLIVTPGFLSGYSAVKDGYTNLGFIGGMSLPAVVHFGHRFVQGAEYAAIELSMLEDSISINYHYAGNFNATHEVQAMAASWV